MVASAGSIGGGSGTAVTVASGGEFTSYDSTVKGSVVSNGTFQIEGSNVEGSVTVDGDAAFAVATAGSVIGSGSGTAVTVNDGEFNIYDGTIEGSVAVNAWALSGGMTTSGQFIIWGSTIMGNVHKEPQQNS